MSHVQTTLLWALGVSLVFLLVYPACNAFTEGRAHTWVPAARAELGIPLRPGFIWAYFSMYLLFQMPILFLDTASVRALGRRLVLATLASGTLYLLLPTRLGWPRQVPAAPYAGIFRWMFGLDRPHNLVPSLHVVYSALIVLALLQATRPWPGRALWITWLLAIGASTVLVHQHHLLDVASGGLLAGLCHRFGPGREGRP